MGYELKKVIVYFLVVLLVFFMPGCCRKENNQLENQFIYEIPVDNEKRVNSSLLTEYNLIELKNFFGDYSTQEKSTFDLKDSLDLDFFTVNQTFPIQFFRFNKHCLYSIYKVKEGGYYYVFWSESDSDKSILVSDTFYIDRLKQSKDFIDVKIGESTYEEIHQIDPSSELILILSNGVYSYSLLQDEKMLQIKYTYNQISYRRDLIVEKIDVVSLDDSFGSKLSLIYTKDLP